MEDHKINSCKGGKVLLVLSLLIIAACNGGNSQNPPVPISVLASSARVGSDDNGNFMALWQSGNSVWARDYPQGVAAAPYHLGQGHQPSLDMAANGDAYAAYLLNGYPSERDISVFQRRFERASGTWQGAHSMTLYSWASGSNPRQFINPRVATHDDSVLFGHQTWNGVDWAQQPREINGKDIRIGVMPKALDFSMVDSTIPDFQYSDVFAANGVDQSQFSLDMGANNEALLTWTQQAMGTSFRGVYASRFHIQDNAAFLTNVQTLSSAQPGAMDSAMNSAGDAVVAWVENHPTAVNSSRILTATYAMSSGSWNNGHAALTTSSLRDDGILQVDMDESGNALVVWADANGLWWSRYDAVSASWSSMSNLMGAGDYRGLALDMASNGDGMASWSFDGDIFVSQFRLASVDWSTPETIGVGQATDVAVDAAGNCLVAWVENGNLYDYQCSDVMLNVSVTGNQGGRISSQPGGIECGMIQGNSYQYCSTPLDLNQMVTLEATPDSGYQLNAWGGDCAGASGNTITLTMDSAKTCTVSFATVPSPPASFTLTVVISGGQGAGEVRSGEAPPLVDCISSTEVTTTCTATYQAGDNVVLSGTAFSGYALDSWSGCTPGFDAFERPACLLTMDSDKTVTAQFITTHNLSVTLDGQLGAGARVGSSEVPAIVRCTSMTGASTTCNNDVAAGTELMLLGLDPIGGNRVLSWSGCSSEQHPTFGLVCRLTMGASDQAVTATFGP